MHYSKHVVKIWGALEISQKIKDNLQLQILQVIQKTEGINTAENGVIILFIATEDSCNNILVEFHDVTNDWISKRYNLKALACRLGNAVASAYPSIYIQCHAFCSHDAIAVWSSDEVASHKDIEEIRAVAKEILPSVQNATKNNCFCEENAIEHRGACTYHCTLSAYNELLKEGAEITSMQDTTELQIRADLYLSRVRESSFYSEIRKRLNMTQN